MSKLAIEWNLLNSRQRFGRYVSTFIAAIVTGAGCAFLITVAFFISPYLFGFSSGKESLPIQQPSFLVPISLVAIVLTAWRFRAMMRTDIEGSQRRMADREYCELLKALGKLPEDYW